MTAQIQWHVILVCPGEDELSLLAELSSRPDSNIVAVCDPDPNSMGANLAEIMGIPIIADLANMPNKDAEFLVHPPFNDVIAQITDTAHQYSLQLVAAQDFPTFMARAKLPEQIKSLDISKVQDILGERDFDFLENETANIHRTLSRIEEALDREALLRWLLGLAIRATGACSGSVMLFDKASEELYLAYADGLSENTLHRTRVRLGEGISGKVAASRQGVIISDNRHPGMRRDRPDLGTAICVPITWEENLLGVLNVSTTEGESHLSAKSLGILESLSHRFGMILDRFLRIQSMHDGQVFKELEESLSFHNYPAAIDEMLNNWARELAAVAGAKKVHLYVLTAGGDLLTADGSGHYYLTPEPSLLQVMASGKPLVLRPGDADDGDGPSSEKTIFHLPLAGPSAPAMITLEFDSSPKAHHFHTISGELLFLLGRHLAEACQRAESADQVDRLTVLASTLSELASTQGDLQHSKDRLLEAVCHLTGAGQARLLEDQVPAEESELLNAIAEQLTVAKGQGWQVTVLNPQTSGPGESNGRPLLLVPGTDGSTFLGLALLDKERLHPLDGASFTEFDALFARRLLPVLESLIKQHAPVLEQVAPVENKGPDVPQVRTDGQPVSWDNNPVQPLSSVQTSSSPQESELKNDFLIVLGREMNRCDRYHNMLGLVAFRLDEKSTPPPIKLRIQELVFDLRGKLRGSDHCAHLADGTIVVIVPEDVQSIPRLKKRVLNLLVDFLPYDNLKIATSSQVYPGVGNSPSELLATVLKTLP